MAIPLPIRYRKNKSGCEFFAKTNVTEPYRLPCSSCRFPIMNRFLTSLLSLSASFALAQNPADFLNRLEPWTDNGSVATAWLSEVTFHEGQFLAPSQVDNVFISQNGLDWAAVETGIAGYAIGVGSDGYLIVGARWDDELGIPVAAAVHSLDGAEWVQEDIPVGLDMLTGVAFGNDAWLAVGQAGVILRKPLGGVWEELDPDFLYPDPYFNGLAFGDGAFVTIAGSSILRSTDNGDTWVRVNSGISGGDDVGVASDIQYRNGLFLLSGDSIASSRDGGLTWTRAVGIDKTRIRSVTYDGVYFFAVGRRLVDGEYLYFNYASVDGINWVQTESEIEAQQNGVALGGGVAVVVGNEGLAQASANYLTQAEAWLRNNLSDAPTNLWKFTADADRDGLPNLAEYAFGSLANDAASAAHLDWEAAPIGDESQSVELTFRSDDPALKFTLYHSENLRDWTQHPLSFDESSKTWNLVSEDLVLASATPLTEGLWRLSIRAIESRPNTFIRIGVEQLSSSASTE